MHSAGREPVVPPPSSCHPWSVHLLQAIVVPTAVAENKALMIGSSFDVERIKSFWYQVIFPLHYR